MWLTWARYNLFAQSAVSARRRESVNVSVIVTFKYEGTCLLTLGLDHEWCSCPIKLTASIFTNSGALCVWS